MRGTLSIRNYGSIKVNDTFEVTASSPKSPKRKKLIRLLGNVHSGMSDALASEGFVGRCSFFLDYDSGDGTLQFDWNLPEDLFNNFLNDVRSAPKTIQIHTTFDSRAKCITERSPYNLSLRADEDAATDVMIDSFAISSKFSQLDQGEKTISLWDALKLATRLWKASGR